MKNKAYTLSELVVVVLIMGVLSAVAVPRLQFDLVRSNQAKAAARTMMTDLRRVRSMALRDASTNDKGFEVKLEGGKSFTEYEIKDKESDTIIETVVFNSQVTVTSNKDKYKFGPLGNLTKGGDGEIVFSSGGKTYTLSFQASTGTITLTEGS